MFSPAPPDPGWRRAVLASWRFVVPGPWTTALAKKERPGVSPVETLRALYAGYVAGMLVIGSALQALTLDVPSQGVPRWVPLLLVGAAGWILGVRAILAPRVVATGNADEALASYRTWFFVQLGLVGTLPVFGLTGAFIGGSRWPFWLGFGLFALLSPVFAPTARNIQSFCGAAERAGATVDPRAALFTR